MTTFFAMLTERGPTLALEKTLSFNQARLEMIAENVANAETPGYRTQQLDMRGFQRALRTALEGRHGDPQEPLVIKSGREVATDAQGFLRVTPSIKPVEHALFHDGTNQSLERQMAELAETGMTQEIASTLLRGRFESLRQAIRGRMQ